MNLINSLDRICEHYPQRTAIIEGDGRSLSFFELRARAQSLAAKWHEYGVKKGDRILIALGINSDLYAALIALWWLGAVAVLPEPSMGLVGIKHAMKTTKPRGLLLGGIYKFLPFVIPEMQASEFTLELKPLENQEIQAADLSEDDAALISFTTGTSGVPKSIVRSHVFMLAQNAAIAPLITLNGGESRDLVGFPVFVIANLGQGVCSVLPNWKIRKTDKADPEKIARHIEKQGVKRLLLNPALVERLVDFGIPRSVDTIFTGGGPVFPDLILKIKNTRPDIKLYAVYGSTEAEPIAQINAMDLSDDDFAIMQAGKGIIAGHPVSSVRVRIIDNEIQVSGDHVVKSYLDPKHDSETKICDKDGILWHKTGDAGYFDEKGRLCLLGRLKDAIGNIFPFPIEANARSWNGVKHAALISINNQAILAIEGNKQFFTDWKISAQKLGIPQIQHISKMPMDKRHGSKIDVIQLKNLLS